MIKLQTQQNIPDKTPQATAIRVASANELTNYEKNKLASIEAQAQQNKIEIIRVNGTRIPVNADTKTVNISVGDLAFKSAITSDEIDNNELFFIKCELD